MDDATVEDVDGDQVVPPEGLHPSRLVNETPGFLTDIYAIG